MRSLPLALACFLVSAPAAAQPRLGARTATPESMVAQLSPASPEEEMRALVAAADAHPLGTLENPVRVGGPDGERAYLARLRCGDGATPRIGARRAAGVGAFGSVAGAYEVACAAAAGRIVFDMYHEEHVETRAPEGFTLRPSPPSFRLVPGAHPIKLGPTNRRAAMRLPLAALALLLAVPAGAQAATPRETMVQLGVAPSEEEVARAVESASDEPLGTEANPVRVSGVEGEHGYMRRLRCADGNAPRIGQRANVGIGVFGSIVDVWQLDCGNAAPGRFSLALDMYHDNHDETQAPAGFTLEPR